MGGFELKAGNATAPVRCFRVALFYGSACMDGVKTETRYSV
jgi:hypothetical protein